MSKKLVQAVARSLGLTQSSSPQLAYGITHGFLAQAHLVQRNRVKDLCVVFRHAGTGKEQDIRDALASGAQGQSEIEAKDLSIDGGTAMLTVRYRAVRGMPNQEVVLARVNALLAALESNSAPTPATCRICATAVPGEPVLLHGIVDRVCPSCVERLEHEAQAAEAQYMARPLNLPLGLAAAAVAGCAGALLYGGVLILTDTMFWAVAIIVGAMVGYGSVKGAGRAGRLVQAMAAFVTVVSVLAGLLGYLGYEINSKVVAEGGTVDWGRFVAHWFDVLMADKHGTLFSLAGGLFGAWTAIQKTRLPGFRTVESGSKSGQLTPG